MKLILSILAAMALGCGGDPGDYTDLANGIDCGSADGSSHWRCPAYTGCMPDCPGYCLPIGWTRCHDDPEDICGAACGPDTRCTIHGRCLWSALCDFAQGECQ